MKALLKNPFAVAFAFGVVFLTVLPFLQRRFLKAPPPLGPLGEFSLREVSDAGVVSDGTLKNHVVLATFAPAPCDATCVERTQGLGRALNHTDDLGDAVHLLTFVLPGAEDALRGVGAPRWHLATGERAALEPPFRRMRDAWSVFAPTDAGTTLDEFALVPAHVLIDQQGQIRGFWRDDSAGRGNAITAARLLAKHGVDP